MTDPTTKKLLLAGAVLGAMAFAGAAQAGCAGAGVVTRIDGQPQDVQILRDGGAVAKPRVLEVMCDGDMVSVHGGTSVMLAINGSGPVRVSGGSPFRVSSRSSQPSVASNAYGALSDKVLKDMKRQPWDVRLRGGSPSLSFGVESLSSGSQQAVAGRRDLLVRMAGGSPGYSVTITGPSGPVASGQGGADGVALSNVDLAPGSYRLDATDASGAHVSGALRVVDTLPTRLTYDGIDDPEVRAAVEAADMARQSPNVWAFESEQRLHAAPRESLDRESVYRLIESYGAGG